MLPLLLVARPNLEESEFLLLFSPVLEESEFLLLPLPVLEESESFVFAGLIRRIRIPCLLRLNLEVSKSLTIIVTYLPKFRKI